MADNQNLSSSENVSKALDIYHQIFGKYLLCGDFNSERTESSLSGFLLKYGSKKISYGENLF